jgi:ketosteroid isomerase-like protein
MTARLALVLCILLSVASHSPAQQNAQDEVLQTTKDWLKGMSTGDRKALNVIMDPHFVATSPAGDVLTKERLVPDDASQAVQQLPAFDLDSPMVRIYGDTAVLMGRLKASADPKQLLDSTFVYAKRDNSWKLLAVHLSPHR